MNLSHSQAYQNILAQPFQTISLKSCIADLKKPSLGLSLFLVGFHCMYFLPLAFPNPLFQDLHSGTFRYYFLSWLLIGIGGALETKACGLWLIHRKLFWVAIFVSAVLIVSLISWMDGEPFVLIITKSIPFYWLILVPAVGLRAQNWPWLWMSLLIHIPFGVAFSLYTYFGHGATSRMEIFEMEGENFLRICTYMSMLLFLMLPVVRSHAMKSIILGLFGITLLKSLFTFGRSAWFLVPVEILMILFAVARSHGAPRFFRRLIVGSTFVALLFALIPLAFSDSPLGQRLEPAFVQAYEGLMGRMHEKGTVVDTVLENERWFEAKTITENMEGSDWIFGKGLAARWRSRFFDEGNERYMVHNTWLNCFYWGGLFLFLTATLPLVWAVRVFSRSRDAAGICCAAFLLLTYMRFPLALITMPTHEWLLFCLVIGACVWHEAVLANRNLMTG